MLAHPPEFSLWFGLRVDDRLERLCQWIVAGGHNEGNAQREIFAFARDRLLILDLHSYRVMRANVGDGIGEKVGAMLLKQTGFLAFLFGGLVNLAGFFLGLDLAFNDAGRQCASLVDRQRLCREGENVDSLDPGVTGVEELLRDDSPGDRTGNVDLYVGANLRSLDIFACLFGFEKQATRLHVIRAEQKGLCDIGDMAGVGVGAEWAELTATDSERCSQHKGVGSDPDLESSGS